MNPPQKLRVTRHPAQRLSARLGGDECIDSLMQWLRCPSGMGGQQSAYENEGPHSSFDV
tara:strand:+ start:22 stop:198 length:177 start_codon:yes stop_codon:yes gene_type:complete